MYNNELCVCVFGGNTIVCYGCVFQCVYTHQIAS